MILNLTNKPFFAFSAMQRLACCGQSVTTPAKAVKTIEDFYDWYDRYENVITAVIVDDKDFVLANDICNAVTCPVVTLDVESVMTEGTWHFKEYNPYE